VASPVLMAARWCGSLAKLPLPATVRRNGAGSGYAHPSGTVEGETWRKWGTEELRPRTSANGGHGGQRRKNRPKGPHLGPNRGAGSCLEQRNRWQRGWRDELEGGAAVEQERRRGGLWRR
jgi:hypothetical protein